MRTLKRIAVALSVMTVVGCAASDTAPTVAAGRSSGVSADRARSAASRDVVVAEVNGRAIRRSQLDDLLRRSHGLDVLQQMLALELARDATRKAAVTVTSADVEAEYARQLDRVYPVAEAVSPAEKRTRQERALAIALAGQGLGVPEFRLKVERETHIRKLAEQRLSIGPEDLQQQFRMTYGAKVQVRLLVCRTLRDAGYARERLEAGEDFATVVQQMSADRETAQQGGLTEPFSLEAPSIAAVLRDALRDLAPGELSQTVRVGSDYVMARLDGRTEPANVRYDDVRAEIEAACRQRRLAELTDAIMASLVRTARLTIHDLTLRQQYEQRRQASGGSAPALLGR